MRAELVLCEVYVKTPEGFKKKFKKTFKKIKNDIPRDSQLNSTTDETDMTGLKEAARTGFWVMRSPSSTIQYKLISMKTIPGYSWQIMIEVPLKDGVIVGTNCVFQELLENKSSLATISSETCLLLQNSYHDNDIMLRINTRNSFDIQVIEMNSNSKITLESMTENHWDRLKQIVMASGCFHQCSQAMHYLPDSDPLPESVANETVNRRLILSCSIENYTKPITAGVEAFTTFQSLPLEDQLILLKEGIAEVGMVLSILEYNKASNTFVGTCVQGSLLICVHMDNLREVKTVSQCYQQHLRIYSEFFYFLQRDILLINLLAAIVFFKTREGLSCPEIIEKERLVYMEILEKYIEAKVKAGHWKASVEEVRYNIKNLMSQVKNVNSIYVEMANAIESKSADV